MNRRRARSRPFLAALASLATFSMAVTGIVFIQAEPSSATIPSECPQTLGTPAAATVTKVGSDCVVTFSANTTWTVPQGVTSIRLLIVGGGAGGQIDGGGGGGGGAGVTKTSVSVTPGVAARVVVGAGGSWGTGGNSTTLDLNADNSAEWVAPGGSAGTGWSTRQGGAGGVASAQNSATLLSGGRGGDGPSSTSHGTNAANSNLGDGFQSDISGTTLWYGGGGGGGMGAHSNGSPTSDLNGGDGGKGGGGRGAAQRSRGTNVVWTYKLDGTTSSFTSTLQAKCGSGAAYPGATMGFPGLNGYGGGGGGGVAYGDGCAGSPSEDDGERTIGGRGGDGVAIIRYAIPTYSVTYNENSATSGSAPGSQTKTHGVNLTLASNTGTLVRTGYTFAGWNTQANGLGTDYAASGTYTLNSALNLFAKWTGNTNAITWDSNGGSSVSSPISFTTGGTVSQPTNPTRTGMVFQGWSTTETSNQGDLNNRIASWPYSPTATSDITLYAIWADALLVYEPFTGSGNIANTSGTGSSGFVGSWVLPQARKQDSAAISGVYTSRPNLALPQNTGFSRPASNTAASGSSWFMYYSARELTTPIPFDSDGTYYLSFISHVPTVSASTGSANAGLLSGLPATSDDTGPWSLMFGSQYSNTFTIDYGNANRATWVSGQTRFSASSTKTSNATTEQTAFFVVAKIVTKASGNDELYLRAFSPSENLPLVDSSITWDVTLSTPITGSGRHLAVETEYAGTIDEIRVGYTYQSVTDPKAVYSVDYDEKGGSTVTNGTFVSGGTVSFPSNPTRVGYNFAGWSATDGGSAVSTPYSPGVENNITLYAVWTSTLAITTPTSGLSATIDQSYTLNISASGGTGTKSYSATGLPNGLSINSTTGAITGTPSAAGNSSVSVTVTDSTGSATTSSFTIAVALIPLTNASDPAVTATTNTLKSISVSWSAVNNASSYTIRLYASNGTTLLHTITGASGTSKTITTSDYASIADNTEYKVSIQAIGTGSYSSSDESGKVSVTTLSQRTITFDSNGGSSVSPIAVNPGSAASKPTDPTRSGFRFAGWSTTETSDQGDLTNRILVWPYTPANSLTLYAIWVDDYSIQLAGSQAVAARVGTSSTRINVVPNDASFTWEAWIKPSDSGNDWMSILDNLAPGNDGQATLFIRETGSGPFLYVGYRASSSSNVSVTTAANSIRFDEWQHVAVSYQRSGGAAGSCSSQGTLSIQVFVNGVRLNTPTTPAFSGCLVSGGLSIGSVGVNAQYKGLIDQVKVWDGVLTDSEIQSSMLNYGVGSVNNTLRAHYNFDDLAASPASGDKIKNQVSDTGEFDLQLFSSTPANVATNTSRSLNSFSLSYNGNSASSGSIASVTGIKPFTTSTLASQGNLLRTGFSFGGWRTQANGGTEFAAGSSFVTTYGNTELFANWSANSYTISFNANGATGGSVPSNQSKIHGTDLTLATNSGTLVRTGYTFAGWSTQADGGGTQYAAGGTYTLNEGYELFARWTGNQYVFNANTGTGSTSALTFAGTTLAAPASAFTSPTGYAFAGWCSVALATVSASCTGTSYAQGANLPTPASSTVTLFAMWTSTLAITTPSSGLSVTVDQSYTLNISASGGTGTKSYSATGLPNGLSIDTSTGVISGTPTTAGNSSVTVTVTDPTGTKTTNSFTISVAQILLNDAADPTVIATAGTLKSISVSWTAVANVSSYTLKMYAADGTTLLQTLTGLSGTSKTITASDYSSIADNTTYQISVQAIGTGNFASSAESGKVSVTTLVTYTVTFNYNSADGGATVPSGTYISGGPEITLPVPTRTGFNFGGWYDNAGFSGSALGSSITTTSSKTIYAKWTGATYTVLYAYNSATGGNSTASNNYTTGSSAISLPTPTRTGYNFNGWFENIALTGSAVSSSYTTTQNRTLYAKWTAINYTLTYNADLVVSGSTVSPDSGTAPQDNSQYTIGQSATLLTNSGSLTRTGYVFGGWVTNQDGSGAALLPGASITFEAANITLYPKWNPGTYTITYNKNGASGDLAKAIDTYQTLAAGLTLPGAGTMTKSGYTFAGWSTSSSGQAVANSNFTTTANLTLYAVWELTDFTISYNLNSPTTGSNPTSQTANIEQTVTISGSGGATKTGHWFSGWNTAADGSGSSFGAGQVVKMPLGGATLYAIWVPDQYRISYNANGGTGGPNLVGGFDEATFNVAYSLRPKGNLARAGYTFSHWTTNVGGTGTKYDENGDGVTELTTFTPTANTTFYAQWTANVYSFSFNPDGGNNSPATQNKTIGQTISMPSAGTKPGYSFGGWTDGSVVYPQGSTYVVGSASRSFTALWTPNVYTIVFDWQGASGTPTPDASYTVGTGSLTLPVIGDRTKDGFTFGGWSETPGGTTAVSNFVPTANDVLYAIWNDGNYTLSYNGQGASVGSGSGSVARGQSITLPTPIRAGFVFNGWYDAETGGNKIGNGGQSHTPNRSKTMHARWVQKSLWGVDLATLESGQEYTASDSTAVDTLLTHVATNTTARVKVPAGALPNGTKVNVQYFKDTNRQSALIPGDNSYFFSVLVSWLSGTGSSATVPNTNAGKPIEVTLTNSQIKAGAMAYMVIGDQVTELGRATQDGTITVQLTEDPEIVVAATAPANPGSVVASGGNQQATISWSAPSTNGGAQITGYTVTASPGGATCTTATTSCSITGLTNGTAYTFSVVATNSVGSSSGASSSSVTPAVVTYTVTFNSNGGSNVSNGSFTSGGSVSEPTAPTRSGFTFDGWSTTQNNAATKVTFPYSPGVTNNITLYALWTQVQSSGGSGGGGSSPTPTVTPRPTPGPTPSPGTGGGSTPRPTPAPTPTAPPSQIGFKPTPPATPVVETGPVGSVVGSSEQVRVVKDAPSEKIVATAGSWQLEIKPPVTQEITKPVTEKLELQFPVAAKAQLAGTGLRPNTTVEAWVFSEPTYVGTIKVGPDGSFASSLNLPKSLLPGQHTLQIGSLNSDGKLVTLSIPITIKGSVTVGTFKGFVAIFTKDLQGQELTAKVAGKWIRQSPVRNFKTNNYSRLVRFTGAGYDIVIDVYINKKFYKRYTTRTR